MVFITLSRVTQSNTVYSVKIRNLNQLRELIRDAKSNVTQEMLRNVWLEVEFQLDSCKALNCGHVEIYLVKINTF